MVNQQDQQQNSDDWLGKLNQIKAARADFDRLEKLLDPDERKTISGNIRADAQRNYERIYHGVKADFDRKIDAYKAASAITAAAKARSINSWEADKLYEQQIFLKIQLYNEYNDAAAKKPLAARIEKLYREAQSSGDRYRQRAAAELLRSLNTDTLPAEAQLPIRLLGREANEILREMAMTDEIKIAIEEEKQAARELLRERENVKKAGATLYEDEASGVFAKLAKTIQIIPPDEFGFNGFNVPEITRININKGEEA